MYKVNIALQEIQRVVLMLHMMSFQLFGKVVAFHADNSIAKIYVIKVVQYHLFLSRLADKHGINLMPAYLPTHLKVKTIYHGESLE